MAEPKTFRAIMVSSTFTDLESHRIEVKEVIEGLGFHPKIMETSGPSTDKNVIETSLDMVRDSSVFIAVISHRYGQFPECPINNPNSLSISELEFNEAMDLDLPILLFIMGTEYPLPVKDIETDPDKRRKLDAFRERAKLMEEGGAVERVYKVFNSQEEFTKSVAIAIGKLSQSISPEDSSNNVLPPNLRAVPRYLGSHTFVGRKAELNTLNQWSTDTDHTMLLFEAIGGSGKSMVTWTWLNDHALKARDDWAGRFWFSFYEGGATMKKFCQEALAYMTGQPLEKFRSEERSILIDKLIVELESRPWLIVMDGLERILVAYHRIDAHQIRDEDVDLAVDQIADRDPRATINPKDEELLIKLTATAQSKILTTSRLTPQALINRAGKPRPGVKHEELRGLKSEDAEALFRACGVTGDSNSIQTYLNSNSGNHPLVIGALAGLVNDYMPDRNNFDAWIADPIAGGKLRFSELDLTQSRNHILNAAIEALPEPAQRLLSTMALLTSGADYTTLKAFNPHSPSAEIDLGQMKLVEENHEKSEAQALFNKTLTQLEKRGLIQYDHALKCYDLHPVVRGVAASKMGKGVAQTIGGQVIDYFSSKDTANFKQAESLEELAPKIQIVTTMTQIGKFDEALYAFDGDLSNALKYNLSAHHEIQRLLQPFFINGWNGDLTVNEPELQSYLLDIMAGAMRDDFEAAYILYGRALRINIDNYRIESILVNLNNLTTLLNKRRKWSSITRLRSSSIQLAEVLGNKGRIFKALVLAYSSEIERGSLNRARDLWKRIERTPQNKNWNKGVYLPGFAETTRAQDLFWRNRLDESDLKKAEQLCRKNRNRGELIECLSLRGEWHLSREEPDLAIEALSESLRLSREFGGQDLETEALYALARVRAKASSDVSAGVERFDKETNERIAIPVAELWIELKEPKRAIAAALRGHNSACGSGKPYTHRYYLGRADALLCELGEPPPEVPLHNNSNDETFEWENDILNVIEKSRLI